MGLNNFPYYEGHACQVFTEWPTQSLVVVSKCPCIELDHLIFGSHDVVGQVFDKCLHANCLMKILHAKCLQIGLLISVSETLVI